MDQSKLNTGGDFHTSFSTSLEQLNEKIANKKRKSSNDLNSQQHEASPVHMVNNTNKRLNHINSNNNNMNSRLNSQQGTLGNIDSRFAATDNQVNK